MKLLFIEDNPDDALLVQLELERAGLTFEHRLIASRRELAAALDEGGWTAIISDYHLPDFSGIEALEMVRARDLNTPFLLVSGTIGEERAVDALRNGANDYVMKDRLQRLVPALTREIREAAVRAERQQLANALRLADERYRRTFEKAPVGIATIDREGRFASVNESFAAMTGYSRDEIVGRLVRRFSHPDELRDLTGTIGEMLRGERASAQGERRAIHKDGHVLWMDVNLSSVCNATGEVEYLIALVDDVTERREARERLALQGRLLDCVQQAVIATDLHGSVIYWSRYAEVLYGWKGEEAIGRNVLDLTPAAGAGEQPAQIFARLQHGAQWSGEMELRRRDGTTFMGSVLDSRLLDAEGRLAGIVGVSMDVTAQKWERDQIRLQKEQLADALMLAEMGSWTYDYATGRELVSSELCRLFGFDNVSNLSLDSLAALIHSDDRETVRQARTRAVSSLVPFSIEYRLRLADGSERVLHERGRFILDENNQPMKTIGVVQDITTRTQTEEELRRRAVQQASVASLGKLALSGAATATLFSEAAAAVRHVLAIDFCEVLRMDPTVFTLVTAAGFPDVVAGSEYSLSRRHSQAALTMAEGAPVIVIDALRESRFMPAELHARLDILSGVTVAIDSWGVLGAHAKAKRNFTTNDVNYLVAVASILAQAIERERAAEEIEIRARQQSAIAELGRDLLVPLEQATLSRVCERVKDGLGVEYSFYLELTADRSHLRVGAGTLWSDDLPNECPLTPDVQSSYTLLSGESVVVDDYRTEERFDRRHITADYGIISGVTVPVTGAGRTVGVLAANSRRARQFRQSDVYFLETVARMLAEAIEREEARQALLASEERFRRIFDGATEMIYTLSRDGRFLAVNPAFERITGCPREEWIGREIFDLIAPADRTTAREQFAKVLETASAVTAELCLEAGGKAVTVEIISFPRVDNGRVMEVHGFGRDVTATRLVEREREQVTRNLQLLLDSTLEGIVTIDPEGRCTMINAAAARLLGFPPEELIGRNVYDVANGFDPVRSQDSPVRDVFRTGTAIELATKSIERSDGTLLPIELSAAPITDGGRCVGVVVTFNDVTERRKLETKLEQVSRLGSLGRLAAIVAHEFNNVLGGIVPFVDGMRLNGSPQNITLGLEHIERSVRRGKRITEDILRFAQPAEPVRSTLDVEAWLRTIALETTSLLPSRYRIEVDCAPETPPMHVDPNQLHQIFTNLILNARDAMPEGGTIAMHARAHAAGDRFAFGAVAHPERFVHLTVTDQGCGMSPETLDRIFEPLFTTKPNGTGLGLPVTHQVVQRHGGEIFVESSAGRGTTFHIFLPMAEQPEPVVRKRRTTARRRQPVSS